MGGIKMGGEPDPKNLMRQTNNRKKWSIFRSNLKWQILVLNVLNFINLLLHFQPDQI